MTGTAWHGGKGSVSVARQVSYREKSLRQDLIFASVEDKPAIMVEIKKLVQERLQQKQS